MYAIISSLAQQSTSNWLCPNRLEAGISQEWKMVYLRLCKLECQAVAVMSGVSAALRRISLFMLSASSEMETRPRCLMNLATVSYSSDVMQMNLPRSSITPDNRPSACSVLTRSIASCVQHIIHPLLCLQCSDAAGRAAGRASGQ